MLRRAIRRFGVIPVVLWMTGASILVSLLATLGLNGWRTDSSGLRIAILVPAIVAPIFSFIQLSLIAQLERARESLQKLSITDELTQTFNRRHFMAVAQQLFAVSQRNNKPFSLILFDADDFKKINDTHGHLVGDRVLKHIADLTRINIRAGDLLARFGGEEFIVLLPEASALKAFDVAQRIQQSLWENPVAQNVHPTVSIGIATFKPNMLSLDDLLCNADDALYRAKNAGKNRIERVTVA